MLLKNLLQNLEKKEEQIYILIYMVIQEEIIHLYMVVVVIV